MTVTCTQVVRELKTDRILGYTLRYGMGNPITVKAERLKREMRAKRVKVKNLTLTEDGRLVRTGEIANEYISRNNLFNKNINQKKNTPSSDGTCKSKSIADSLKGRIMRLKMSLEQLISVHEVDSVSFTGATYSVAKAIGSVVDGAYAFKKNLSGYRPSLIIVCDSDIGDTYAVGDLEVEIYSTGDSISITTCSIFDNLKARLLLDSKCIEDQVVKNYVIKILELKSHVARVCNLYGQFREALYKRISIENIILQESQDFQVGYNFVGPVVIDGCTLKGRTITGSFQVVGSNKSSIKIIMGYVSNKIVTEALLIRRGYCIPVCMGVHSYESAYDYIDRDTFNMISSIKSVQYTMRWEYL